MWFEINDQQPIYRQLTTYIEQQILDKQVEPDEALPSVRTLAVDLKVNPQTILKSFQDLLSRNIVYKKRGLGIFVAPNARELLIAEKKDAYLHKELVMCIQRGLALDIPKDELLQKIHTILHEEQA